MPRVSILPLLPDSWELYPTVSNVGDDHGRNEVLDARAGRRGGPTGWKVQNAILQFGRGEF